MFNRVTFMGRICHDLELKTTPNKLPVLTFRIAVERQYKAKGAERKTDFFTRLYQKNNIGIREKAIPIPAHY